MLEALDRGYGVLTASELHPDLPTIHSIGADANVRDSVKHFGFGCFGGKTPHGEFSFDGGGAMRDREHHDGDVYLAWCPLAASKDVLADLKYDVDKARAVIEERLAVDEGTR